MFAGGGWIVRRIDTVEQRLGTRIDTVEQQLSARIDTVNDRLGIRIDDLTGEVTDLKVAVARWEGPPRRLQVRTR